MTTPRTRRSGLRLSLTGSLNGQDSGWPGRIFQPQAPNTPPPRRVTLTIAAWALAGGLGIVGLASGIARGDPRSGLLFILAGAIFCLAAPVPRLPGDDRDTP